MLQELAVVFCLDVHIILPLLAIYKVRGKQAERDLLQCAFGLGYVDEIVTALVAYFTQFLPFSYTVNSNIYAGVTNVTNIDGSKVENISSTFDNLINIASNGCGRRIVL